MSSLFSVSTRFFLKTRYCKSPSAYPSNIYGNTALQEVVVTGYGGDKARGFENEIAFTKIKIRYEIFAKFGIK